MQRSQSRLLRLVCLFYLMVAASQQELEGLAAEQIKSPPWLNTGVCGIRTATLKPLVLKWATAETSGWSCGATLSLSVEKQMTCYFINSHFAHSCGRSVSSLVLFGVTHTESINILCGEWKFSVFALRNRFPVTFYFFPHIAQCTKECSAQLVVLSVAPFLHQPSNSAVLVWCCVFCLERRVVIKFTSC